MRLFILRVLAFLGIALSLYLINQHIHFVIHGESGGICGAISARLNVKGVNCDATEGSVFSSLMGVPTASFGVLYFLGFFLFLVIGRPARPSEGESPDPLADPFWSVVALFSLVGLLVSITLALISGLLIHSFCVGCAFVYLVTLAMAAFSVHVSVIEWLAQAFGGFRALWTGFLRAFGDDRAEGTGPARNATMTYFFLLVPLALVAPYIMTDRVRSSVVLTAYKASPKCAFRENEGAVSKGKREAPLQIVLFADFQCPHCKALQKDLPKLLEHYPADQYRLTYKFFPLGKNCNPMMREQKQDHPYSCDLAAMGQALAKLGKFWEFYGDLYVEPQASLYDSLKAVATKAGIEYIQWVTLSKNEATIRQVGSDIAEGILVGLPGTPAIYVNGKLLGGRPSVENIDITLKYALRHAEEIKKEKVARSADKDKIEVSPTPKPPETSKPTTGPAPAATATATAK